MTSTAELTVTKSGMIEHVARTPRRLFMVVAGPLFVLYLLTATWTLPYNIDAFTNVLTAHEIGVSGDVYLDDYAALAVPDYIGNISWVVPTGEGSFASQYPPGAAVLAAPLYAVWPGGLDVIQAKGNNIEAPPVEIAMPPLGPAAITAALATAVAIGLLSLVFLRLSDTRSALIGALVAGLATSAWSVAADKLWLHTGDMLWLAVATYLVANQEIWAGFGYGMAILTRPHTALISAATGLGKAVSQRSIRPVIRIGIGSAAGLAGLVVFNQIVFGSASILGGYGSAFNERAASLNLIDYLGNVSLALVHPVRGLLVYSPFLLVLVPGLRRAWQVAPAWVKGSAVGGVLYLLLQLKANRYSGGAGFWAYRYPIEMLVAAAPLLFLAYTRWVADRPRAVRIFIWATMLSVGLQGVGAIFT